MQKKILVSLQFLMMFTFAVSLCSCRGQTGGYAPSPSSPISISPASVTLAINNLKTFSAVGGIAPYSFSVISGSGSISSTAGTYTAPNSLGSEIVRVSDSTGLFVDATVTINAALQIAPVSQTMAPSGTLSFTSAGGVPPISYAISGGLGSIDSVTGVYTAAASVGTATITATDSYGNTSVAMVTITNVLNISPASKTLAVGNSATFVGSGGTAPYTFSKFSGVGSMNASTGVYSAGGVAGSAVVRVTDSVGATASANITINAALSISPSTQTMVINGVLNFSATGGVSPYTYTVFSGGGSINSATGVYTAPATAGSAVVRVTDSLGNTSNSTVTINAALAISPATASVVISGTQAFTSTGGVSPYVYSIVAGGGSINASTGLFTAPVTPGSVTVRSTDSLGNTSSAAVTVIIASGPFTPQNFSVSGTYVVPSSGCTSMVVKIWGGGGGAGGGYAGYLGLNGGTGDYRSGTITVVAGDTLNIHLGLKGMGGANGASFPAVAGASGTTTGVGNGAAGGASLASGGGGGGGGGASSIVNGSGTTLVLATGGGGGAGASANSGLPVLNVGGSGSLGIGPNDSGTYANCVSYGATPANCAADRVSPTNANGTAGTTGQTGGGGGGGSGGTSSGLGGMGGRGGTFYGSPYRAGGGNAGGSIGLTPSADTTHGDKGLGDTFNAGTPGTDGYVSLMSCS